MAGAGVATPIFAAIPSGAIAFPVKVGPFLAPDFGLMIPAGKVPQPIVFVP
jgi:hypothetical protein